MCEVLSRIEDRGISRGREEGISLMAGKIAGNLKGYLTDAQIAEVIAKSREQAQQSK